MLSSMEKSDWNEFAVFIENVMTANLTPMQKSIDKNFAELRGDIAELKTDVAELKTDVAVLKTDVAVLKIDVADLKENSATKTDLADLRTELKGEIKQIKVMQEREVFPVLRAFERENQANKNAIQNLTTRVERLEAKVQ